MVQTYVNQSCSQTHKQTMGVRVVLQSRSSRCRVEVYHSKRQLSRVFSHECIIAIATDQKLLHVAMKPQTLVYLADGGPILTAVPLHPHPHRPEYQTRRQKKRRVSKRDSSLLVLLLVIADRYHGVLASHDSRPIYAACVTL